MKIEGQGQRRHVGEMEYLVIKSLSIPKAKATQKNKVHEVNEHFRRTPSYMLFALQCIFLCPKREHVSSSSRCCDRVTTNQQDIHPILSCHALPEKKNPYYATKVQERPVYLCMLDARRFRRSALADLASVTRLARMAAYSFWIEDQHLLGVWKFEKTYSSILGALRVAALECDTVALVLETLRGDQTLDLWRLGVWLLALTLWLNLTTDDELADLNFTSTSLALPFSHSAPSCD